MVLKIELKDMEKTRDTANELAKAVVGLTEALRRVDDLASALHCETVGLGMSFESGEGKEVE